MNKKVKIFAFVTLGIALLVGGFTLFGGSSSAPTGTDSMMAPTSTGSPLSTSMPAGVTMGSPIIPGSAMENNEFSALLSRVKSISLDTSIFTNTSYLSLRDYPVVLGTDIIGRNNPFAPIGVDSGDPVVENGSIEVLTLQPGKITGTTAEFGAQVTIHNNFPVTVAFEYGINDTFANATNPQTLAKSGPLLITVSGLTPATNYVVRAVVVRGSTTRGNTVPFTTLPISKSR